MAAAGTSLLAEPEPWPEGDHMIADVAQFVTLLPSFAWNKGVAAKVDPWWAWNDPGVKAAYALRDPGALFIALLNASLQLPVRPCGRAQLLLVIALAKAKRSWRTSDLMAMACGVGISRRTMQRAKQDLRLRSQRRGGLGARGRWYWTAKDAK